MSTYVDNALTYFNSDLPLQELQSRLRRATGGLSEIFDIQEVDRGGDEQCYAVVLKGDKIQPQGRVQYIGNKIVESMGI